MGEERLELLAKDALSVYISVIPHFLHSLSTDFLHLLSYPVFSSF